VIVCLYITKSYFYHQTNFKPPFPPVFQQHEFFLLSYLLFNILYIDVVG